MILLAGLSLASGQPGTLDESFVVGKGFDGGVYALSLQSTGRILAGGDFTMFNGTRRDGLARLLATGALDSSFTASLGDEGVCYALATQPMDGKIVVGGEFGREDRGYLARFSSEGAFDSTLTIDPDSPVYALATVPFDTPVYLGGDFSYLYKGSSETSRNFLARFSGNTIASWNVGGSYELNGPDSSVYAITVASDESVLVGGDFSSITYGEEETPRQGIARLLKSSGRVDTTFSPGTGPDDSVVAIVTQSDGKILVGGSFTNFNGVTHHGIVRLNSNGSVDSTFVAQCNVGSTVRAIAVQLDGKILIGGDFATVSGHASSGIARLNSNGVPDTTFSTTGIVDGEVYAIYPLSSGQVLIGGYIETYSPVGERYCFGIARLNGDQAPRILTQPVSRIVAEGETVSFITSASGAGTLDYKWYRDGAPLMEDALHKGVTTPTLTISNAQYDDEGLYSVEVRNVTGSVVSKEVELTIGDSELRLATPMLVGGKLQLQIQGADSGSVVIYASEDLRSWQPIITNSLPSGTIQIPATSARRFFRAEHRP